jgi:TP901 family phage tail tape measure protein
MADKYAVATVFKVFDQATAPLNKIGVKGNAVGKALKKDFFKAQDQLASLGKAAAKAGLAIAAAGAAAAGAFAVKGIKDAIEFNTAFTKVSTIADTTKVSLGQLNKAIMDVSNKTGVAASDLAKMQYDAIASGIDTADSVGFLSTAIKASKAGFTDTGTVINSLTSIMNAYKLEAKDAEKIAGQMLITNKLGKTSFEDLNKSLGKVLPTAARLNIGTDELFASITSLTANAIETPKAMKGMEKIFESVQKPTDAVAKAARRLGIDFSASALKSKGLTGFLEDIKKKTGGSEAAIMSLFGSVESLNAINVLTGRGADAFTNAMEQMKNASGAVDSAFNKVMATPAERWAKIMNKMKNGGINLGTALLPIIEKVMERVDVFVDKIKDFDFTSIAEKAGIVFDNIMSFAGHFINLAGFIWKLRVPILAVAGAIGIYKVGMLAAALATNIHTGALKAASIAKKIATVAQWAYNAAMSANPIALALIIIGVIALIAAIVLLVKNWDKVKEVFAKVGKAIGGFFSGIGNKIGTFAGSIKTKVGGAFSSLINKASEAAKKAVNAFAERFPNLYQYITDLVSRIVTTFKKIVSIVGPIIKSIINVFKVVFGSITDIFKQVGISAFNVFKTIFISIFNVIKAIFTAIKNVIDSVFTAVKNVVFSVFNVFKTIFFSILKIIKGVFLTIFDTIFTIFDGLIGIWKGDGNIFVKIWKSVQLIFTSIWGAILNIVKVVASAFNDIWDSVKNVFITAWKGVVGIFSTIWRGIVNVFSVYIEGVKNTAMSIVTAFIDIFKKIKTGFINFGNAIKGLFVSVIEGIKAIWSPIINFFNFSETIKNISGKVFDFISIFTGPFGIILNVIKELFDNWSAVVEVFKTDGIIAGFQKLGGVILSAVLKPIQGLLEMLSKIPGVKKLLGPAVEKINELRENLNGTGTVINPVNNITQPVTTNYETIRQATTVGLEQAKLAGNTQAIETLTKKLEMLDNVTGQTVTKNISAPVSYGMPDTVMRKMNNIAPRQVTQLTKTTAVPSVPQYPVMDRNSRTVAAAAAQPTRPMTRSEQYRYSETTNRERVDINVKAEPGTSARVPRQVKSPNVRLERSGAN